MGVLRRPHIGPHSSIRTPNKAFTGGASGSFDPTSIAGMVAWFKADAGTSTTTDGVAVSQWNDQAATPHNAVQATGANQPLYKAAIQNGLPAVLFDGINDYMQASGVTVAQPDTIFAVAKNTAVDGTNRVVYDGSVSRQDLYRSATDHFVVTAGTDQSVTPTWGSTTFHQTSTVYNGASSALFIDGVSATLPGNPGANALTGLNIGTFDTPTPTTAWQGYIAEILIYSGALSTVDRQSVESYLKTKWGTP